MAGESSLQSGKQRNALCAQGGQIATDTAKRVSASHRAETPRNLLLELDHAHITLRLIVVKIHPEIFQEVEEGVLVFAHPIEQVASRALLASSPCAWWGRGSWMGQIPFVKQREELHFPIGDQKSGQARVFLASALGEWPLSYPAAGF
jgi:hypothetical protein